MIESRCGILCGVCGYRSKWGAKAAYILTSRFGATAAL
ncbi:Uncharacterised protein [Hungatella hathewayi]|uniref:Uncharacterized protein n=1 Tax=Hungatella hathewayi TaxID=154046 RepID=A0A6N3I3J0_9FIRM